MVTRTSALTRLLRAPNPGPMTLDGTNSYVIGAPESEFVVVVDPGPNDAGHVDALTAIGTVELILITHFHGDHTDASAELSRRTGAPVRAFDPAFCIDGEPLTDGEVLEAGGTRVTVVATPGHSADSVCFLLTDDDGPGSILMGDTLLGRGSTVLARPDGSLADYLRSLRRLQGLGPLSVLPGHGPTLPDLQTISGAYLEHRRQRLDEVRSARRALGRDASVSAVTDRVYPGVDAAVRFAAEHSVEAQLEYLDAVGDDLTV